MKFIKLIKAEEANPEYMNRSVKRLIDNYINGLFDINNEIKDSVDFVKHKLNELIRNKYLPENSQVIQNIENKLNELYKDYNSKLTDILDIANNAAFDNFMTRVKLRRNK